MTSKPRATEWDRQISKLASRKGSEGSLIAPNGQVLVIAFPQGQIVEVKAANDVFVDNEFLVERNDRGTKVFPLVDICYLQLGGIEDSRRR